MRNHLCIRILSGTSETLGACVVVEAGGQRILVDPGIGPEGVPPPLEMLAAEGAVTAIIITHAHIDHAGALPLAMRLFPEAPVLLTPATNAFLPVLFAHSELEESGGDWEPAFSNSPIPRIAGLAVRLQPVAFDQPFSLPTKQNDEWQLTFRRAGHLLGAAMVLLETRYGSVLISGDVSLTPQHTVGRALPPRQSVDVLVLESTFGNRNHPVRKTEEAKLVAQVRTASAREGHILIAASALGEAQEVIASLVVSRLVGQEARKLWIDGLVRNITPIFAEYVPGERPSFKQLIALHGNLFSPRSGQISWVGHPAERGAILGGLPAVIVSSAPDLHHGPSASYAALLAPDDQSTILVPARATYTPSARHTQALIQSSKQNCTISSYSLIAHADAQELVAMVTRMRPRKTVLMHGHHEARRALAARLESGGLACLLPSVGESICV